MSFVFFLRFLAAFFPTQGSFCLWSVQAGTGVTWGFKRKGTWALGFGAWDMAFRGCLCDYAWTSQTRWMGGVSIKFALMDGWGSKGGISDVAHT